MAISISSLQKKESIKITTKIFWNLIALLGVVFLVLVLLFFYDTNLNSKINDVKLKIQEIESKRDTTLEKEMKNTLDTYKKIYPAISKHTRARKVLDFLEENAYKGVTFSNFTYNRKENSISFNAVSKTASNLSMQLAVFKKAKGVQNIEVGGFSMSEGTINLQLKIIIDPSISKF